MPLKFGVLSIKKRKVHHPEDERWGEQYRPKSPKEMQPVGEVPPILEAPTRVRDTGTRAWAKRTSSKGVKAAREGSPQSVSFDAPFQTG